MVNISIKHRLKTPHQSGKYVKNNPSVFVWY